jgi:hypothetical protein
MIARVFPRRTKASPADELAFFDEPPLTLDLSHIAEVHVSVTFTWDVRHAEWLMRQWEPVAPVKIGGPATGMRGEEFVSGKYLKPGYVITSRGCPNRCWFCSVWRRDGNVRELPITEGWNVLDDNLLATSPAHQQKVFEMLLRVKSADRRVEFTGGLEAAKLEGWHVTWLRRIKPKQMFFAYDTPDDYEPLVNAGKLLHEFPAKSKRCYVLIGGRDDTISKAELRLVATMGAGFLPMAMLYRDGKHEPTTEWKQFQRQWARPALMNGRIAE